MHPFGAFPATRLRRLRRHDWLRRAVAETTLVPADLVWPLFVHEGRSATPVPSMPGVGGLVLRVHDRKQRHGRDAELAGLLRRPHRA
ncbi:MAG: porphobilinogen synthase, partial [Planctomycetaceae bacterium]